MKLFFDLDGTLIDASDRLYDLFCHLVPECEFSKDEYWNLKRNKINHEIILNKYFPNYSFKEFNEKWLDLIETEEFLNKDKLKEGVIALLKKLTLKNDLYVVTARQRKAFVLKELKNFKIDIFFKDILVTENKTDKEKLISQIKINSRDVIIGDMGLDIRVGKSLGLKTIAVSDGFMSKDKLIEYQPDYIFHQISLVKV